MVTWASVPHLNPSRAGWVWAVGWSGLAILISLATEPVRCFRSPSLAGALAWLGLVEAWRGLLTGRAAHWTFLWGSWWSVAGAWCILGAASVLILRHSPGWSSQLPICLFLALCVQGVAAALGVYGLWSRWLWGAHWSVVDGTGLLSSHAAWSALSVISLPILWAWRKWAVVPALVGLLASSSSSAWLAGVVGWVWPQNRGWVRWGLVGLAGGVIWWRELNFRVCVEMRLDTWVAVLKTILDHPWGIGWGMNSYQAVAAYSSVPVLPHPASDWLMLPLRYGWWTIFPFVLGSLALWRLPRSPGIQALCVAWWLAAWQTSVSFPQVGMWVWIIWMVEHIRRTDGGASKVGTG